MKSWKDQYEGQYEIEMYQVRKVPVGQFRTLESSSRFFNGVQKFPTLTKFPTFKFPSEDSPTS